MAAPTENALRKTLTDAQAAVDAGRCRPLHSPTAVEVTVAVTVAFAVFVRSPSPSPSPSLSLSPSPRQSQDVKRYKKKKDDAAEPEADPERDQGTVFAYQIALKADEIDVFEFFSSAGKVWT